MIEADQNRKEKLLPKTSKCSNLIKSDIADQSYREEPERWYKPGTVTSAQVIFTAGSEPGITEPVELSFNLVLFLFHTLIYLSLNTEN